MRRSTLKPNSTTKCAKVVLLTLLISLARANCEGKIQLTLVEDCNGNLTLQYSGSKVTVIDYEGAASFGLFPEDICVETVYRVKGMILDHCYLKGKEYRQLHSPEVQSIYEVQNVKLVNDTATPVILHQAYFVNEIAFNTMIDVHINAEIFDLIKHENVKISTHKAEDSVETGTLGSIFESTTGGVTMVYQVCSEQTSYEHTWGQTERKIYRKIVEIGGSSEIVLGPYSNLTIVLSGLQITSVYDITYRNYITGLIVGVFHYKNKTTDHLFVDVKDLLPASSLVQTYTERIHIHHYKADFVKWTKGVGKGPHTI